MLGCLFGVVCMCCLQITDFPRERKRTMRKRNVQILFRLTEEEAEHLNELVRKSGRSKEALFKRNGKGLSALREAAPEFYKMCVSCPPLATVSISLRLRQTPSALWIHRCSVRKQGSGTNFRLTFAKGICFHAGHRNGGLRDMGCAWQARPSN